MLEIVRDRGLDSSPTSSRITSRPAASRISGPWRRLVQRAEPESHIDMLRRAKLRTLRQKRRWR